MDVLHDLTLGDVLREHRRSRPQQCGYVCNEHRATYAQFDERVNQMANALISAGVGAGDRVLWLGQNCHRLLETYLACAKTGSLFIPANWRQSEEELNFILDDSEPKIVIWQREEIGETAEKVKVSTTSSARWLCHDETGEDSYEAFIATGARSDPGIEVDPTNGVIGLYTGAFGGRPNCAVLSHNAILAQDTVIAQLQQITDQTSYLNSGPMFHMATLMSTFATFRMGGTNVLTRRVDAAELCRLIDAEKINYGLIFPPTVVEILALNSEGKYDLSTLRTFPGSPEWNAMITVDHSPWGTRPAGYGQTEVTGMLTFNALGGDGAGTSGRASPLAKVMIVDPDGNEVVHGETGEIVAQGPIVTNGYLNRPEVNAERLRGGWWHTNDLGKRELDGSITFIGPKTRIVKSAAENIYPAEVEACLNRHEAVKEAAIIGVPDKVWSQRVLAVIVLHEGQSATADDIIEHCKSHIASYKKPSMVEFIDALPRQGWAVDYDALDERFGGGGYPGLS